MYNYVHHCFYQVNFINYVCVFSYVDADNMDAAELLVYSR